MKIATVYPTLPPVRDGIADYTVLQAKTLSGLGADVTILSAQQQWTPVPGVHIRHAFQGGGHSIMGVAAALEASPPDWLIIQYNPASYSGRFQANPFFPLLLGRIRSRFPSVRVCLVLHEAFSRFEGGAVVAPLWQRVQLYLMGLSADLIVSAASIWCTTVQRWYPETRVAHLPVSSNIPRAGLTQKEARARLCLNEEVPIVGLFGSVGPGRRNDHLQAALGALSQRVPAAMLLYVGFQGHRLRDLIDQEVHGIDLVDLGEQPPEQVSAALTAMDVFLAPYRDGVSTRRGSFMAALQHGLPTVTTVGNSTDALLAQHDGRAFLGVGEADPVDFGAAACALLQNRALQDAMRQSATALYNQHFDWKVTTARLHTLLSP